MRILLCRAGKCSLFSILAVALLAATFVPLVFSIGVWRFGYARDSNWALGLAQIETALSGAEEVLRVNGNLEGISPAERTALIKRLLTGPIVSVSIGPSEPSAADAAFALLYADEELSFSEDRVLTGDGGTCGVRDSGGSWSLTDPRIVAAAAARWDGLEEDERRSFANAKPALQVRRDPSRAVIRVGSTGYVWALNFTPRPGMRSYEVFHPQIEAVDVTEMANSRGEFVGLEISSLRGGVRPSGKPGTFRYDYKWRNPQDGAERKKIVLMRYVREWDIVLCAGLYEDEFFLPARIAETMAVSSIVLIGGVFFGFSFFFAGSLSRSLNRLSVYSIKTAESEGFVHGAEPIGIRELDELSDAMRYMEEKVSQRESALQRELAEKSTLIEEVHHRVKNNLAVLSGIISLQGGDAEGPEARRTLAQLGARVNSMAMVYQQLMGADSYSSLAFDRYLEGLLAYHQSSISSEGRPAERSERLDPVRVSFDAALTLGLIANELLSNAYRHGVPSEGPRRIGVELAVRGGAASFSVSDNGPGMGSDTKERIGLSITRALCAQMKAELFFSVPEEYGRGVRAEVRFAQ